jgi:hypothetical protein
VTSHEFGHCLSQLHPMRMKLPLVLRRSAAKATPENQLNHFRSRQLERGVRLGTCLIWDAPTDLHLASARRSRNQRSITWPTTKIQTKSNRAKRSLGSIITTRATCPEKPWIAANQSLSSERMLTGYAAVISMIKAAMIDEAIGRGRCAQDQVERRDRAHSAVPEKNYGAPTHSADNN